MLRETTRRVVRGWSARFSIYVNKRLSILGPCQIELMYDSTSSVMQPGVGYARIATPERCSLSCSRDRAMAIRLAPPSPPNRKSHPIGPPKYESHSHLVAAGHPHPWPLTLPSSERAANREPLARDTVVSLARASSTERRPLPERLTRPSEPSSPRVSIGQHLQGSTPREQGKRASSAGQGYWSSGVANWQGQQLLKPRDLRDGLITSDASGELERRCRRCLVAALDPELLSRAESQLTPRPQLAAAEFARALRQLLMAPISGGVGFVAAAQAQIEAHCARFLDRVPPSWRASDHDRGAGAVKEATSALLAHVLARLARSCFEADAVAAAENLFAQALAAPSVALAAGAGRGGVDGSARGAIRVFIPPIL
jgi:hypothetical protein